MGERFYARARPTRVSRPQLIRFNHELAASLKFAESDFDAAEAAAVFSGKLVPAGADPLAMAYAGHQFGHFNPRLGDGRALLLGELLDDRDSVYEVQLKGSGRTEFSRDGDGRAALGPVLREYLLSEAMAALHVPTTRALAVVATGERVARERMLPGGVITRVATSFVRIGTFQYFASQGDTGAVKALADFVIERAFPELAAAERPYAAFLQAVIERQARLIARWMQLGFIHGVMNTDNVSIAGETIDYGPCAFMDAYAHDRVFSSIDREGRYAYNNQPGIGLWNLTRFAECLLPLLAENQAQAIKLASTLLDEYAPEYERVWLAGMRAKCGLSAIEGTDGEDKSLLEALLNVMADNEADFALTFFHLSRLPAGSPEHDVECRRLFARPIEFDRWARAWRERLKRETLDDERRQSAMRAVNPVYIPRNHQIEAAIRAAEDRGDYAPFHDLYEVLRKPFDEQPGKQAYQLPPEPEEVVCQTFCGT